MANSQLLWCLLTNGAECYGHLLLLLKTNSRHLVSPTIQNWMLQSFSFSAKDKLPTFISMCVIRSRMSAHRIGISIARYGVKNIGHRISSEMEYQINRVWTCNIDMFDPITGKAGSWVEGLPKVQKILEHHQEKWRQGGRGDKKKVNFDHGLITRWAIMLYTLYTYSPLLVLNQYTVYALLVLKWCNKPVFISACKWNAQW